MNTYTVQKGDSLYSIAQKYDITVDELKKLNNLTSNIINVGQVLNIRRDNLSSTKTYTVSVGDSLYGIAKQFGTTVDDIKRLNNLTTDNITVGQILAIKEDTAPTTYTVEKGDTLYSIAKKFNLSLANLLKYNNLDTNSVLKIGQVLNLYSDLTTDEIITMPVYENYTVKRGDSLYSIAQKYNISVDQLKKDNGLTSNILTVGQILKIKVGEESFGVLECFGEGSTNLEKEYITYTVKRGDSLYSIANKYNTSVDNIKRLNNLSSTNLSIGQILKIKEVS